MGEFEIDELITSPMNPHPALISAVFGVLAAGAGL